MSFWTRLRNTINSKALDEEIHAEVESHLEQLRESGLDERSFGNPLRFREESRDVRTIPFLDALRSDLRFSLRQIARNKTVMGAVILSLALGIGATTSALRLVDAGFLRPLAVRAPERLHFLRYSTVAVDGTHAERDAFSYREFETLRQVLKGDADLMMVSFADRRDVNWGSAADAEKVSRQYVSGSLFEDFRISPAAGRLFGTREDDFAADHAIAVISHDYWQRRFGADPSVIGKTFRCDGLSFTVVGVVHPSFTGTSPGAFTDIFLPLLANRPAVIGDAATRRTWARILVHLRPHASFESAQDRLRSSFVNHRRDVARSLPAGTPQKFIDSYTSARLSLMPAWRGISNFHRDFRLPLTILTATASLVLLLCCVSAANLLIANGAARAREMALRISIGSGRGRLVRLLMTESLIIGLTAAGLGILFSLWATPFLISQLNSPDNPMRLHLPVDARMLAFGGVLALAVTMLFGLLPAFHASSIRPVEALKTGNQQGRLRLMSLLVSGQVAFCFVVCLVAGTLVASLRHIDQSPVGFAANNVLLVELEAAGQAPNAEPWRDLSSRVSELPGVTQAAYSLWPLHAGSANLVVDLRVQGRPAESGNIFGLFVSESWFSTMRIPVVSGRDFRPEEPGSSVIVNERFVRNYLNGRNPIGEQIFAYRNSMRIVGVVKDIRMREIREAIRPTIFCPIPSTPVHVLTLRLEPSAYTRDLPRAIRQLVAQQFPHIRVENLRPQTDLILAQTVRERLLARLSSFFAFIALIMSGTGLYALLSFAVTQRRREIGIRMGLGARVREAAGTVWRYSLVAGGSGIAAGLTVGLITNSLLQSFVFEVSGTDPGVMGVALLALAASAASASAAPALRVARMNPASILRAD